MSNIATLPRWKRDSTPGEWLMECAGLAMESPEKWQRIALVVNEMGSDGIPKKTNYHAYGIESNSELIGTLEVGKLLVFEALQGRR